MFNDKTIKYKRYDINSSNFILRKDQKIFEEDLDKFAGNKYANGFNC